MATKKTIFIAFAIEDERQRDFLKGQSLNTNSPFEYIDMSVKEAYDSDWKAKVRTRIKRSDGVIALISNNSLSSSGQKWEIACAKEEGKKVNKSWRIIKYRETHRVITSSRKFGRFGGLEMAFKNAHLLWESDRKLREKSECDFWYDVRKE